MQEEPDWIATEFEHVDLQDKRRNARLRRLARKLAAQPSASLPQACERYADLRAAYRFFDNSAVTAEAIQQGHVQATRKRCADVPVVLAVQDTSLIDFSKHPCTTGLGPLATKEGRGFFVHSTIAVTPERLMLGVLDQQTWVRDGETYSELPEPKKRPLEEKESYCWVKSLQALDPAAQAAPKTIFVSVADREADLYDLLVHPRRSNVQFLVRASQDRRIEGDHKYLWTAMQQAPARFTIQASVPARHGYSAREACLTVRYRTLTLRPPQHRTKEALALVSVQVVWAHEEDPPPGQEPIAWMLLTTLPVQSDAQAEEILGYYACRWQIELYHKVLKSGCRVEAKQLESGDQLIRCFSLYAVVAWRILYATMLSRSLPEAACTVLLSSEEWQALYCHLHETCVLPVEVPALRTAVRWIGRLGGFLARPHDGEPGVTVMWRGFQRLMDIAHMYKVMTLPQNKKCGKR